MKIMIAGGTGFIGQALIKQFLSQQHEIKVIGRDKSKTERLFANAVTALNWQEFEQNKNELLRSSQLVINLTGANIGNRLWTNARKKEILDSRIIPTRLIANACSELGTKAPALFNASAVGIYGFQSPEIHGLPPALTEITPIDFNHANDFLSHVGREWEKATWSAKDQGVRVVNMRFGVVLGQGGGVLSKLKIPFLFFLGGLVGNGRQPFSWIALPDLIKGIEFLITNKDIQGPVNFVAPECVTQKALAKSLGKVLHRPSFIPTPAFIIKFVFGQMGNELLLNGQHVKPEVLLANDFKFNYPDIESALKMCFEK